MISAYFESTNGFTELIAQFVDDETYNLCVPALEAEAARRSMILTETEVERAIVDKARVHQSLLAEVCMEVASLYREDSSKPRADYRHKVIDLAELVIADCELDETSEDIDETVYAWWHQLRKNEL